MITAKKLQKGDKIGIISTARKITKEELESAIKIIEGWGLTIVLGKNIYNDSNQFSGTINERANDLQCMIEDKQVKAILCARGGYGTIQIIDFINFSKLYTNPKWIIGYSDVTVLHSQLNKLSVSSMHATMPINFKTNTLESLESLKKCLFGIQNTITYASNRYNKYGKIKGEVVGGNLSILYSLLGSDSDLDTKNKILFIEDLDEYLYHIDRMMMSLKRNKKFEGLKGLIVGGMSDIKDNTIPFGKNAQEIILDHIKQYSFPVCFNFPAGHLNDNRCILFGVESTLEITKEKVVLKQ